LEKCVKQDCTTFYDVFAMSYEFLEKKKSKNNLTEKPETFFFFKFLSWNSFVWSKIEVTGEIHVTEVNDLKLKYKNKNLNKIKW
jgi:hypothetical protein